MKKYFTSAAIPHVVIAILVSLLPFSCSQTRPETTNAAPERDSISLTLIWEKLGDENGRLNYEDETPTSVENAQFSPDEKLISSVAKGDFTIRLWNAADGEQIWKITTGGETECVSFTADGKYLVTGGEDKMIRVVDVTTGKVIRSLADVASIEGLRISNNGKLLATGNEAGQIHIWDISSPSVEMWPEKPIKTFLQGADHDRDQSLQEDVNADVNQLDWTEDDAFLISAGRNKVLRKWAINQDGNDPVTTYEGHPGTIKSARLITGDSLLISGSGQPADGTAIVWNVASGESIKKFPLPNMRIIETVEFTPNGKFLLIGGTERTEHGNGRIYFFRVNELRKEKISPVLVYPTWSQEYFYFNRDGSRLLVSGGDGGLRLFSVTYH